METELSGSRILVPLDGSVLAERALPAAERIARATGSTIVLARIVPLNVWTATMPGAALPAETYQRMVDDQMRLAQEYLERVAGELRLRPVPVQTHVELGEAVSALLGMEQRLRIGLIVMTTHARIGMARLALGSVADGLVRGGQVPVLLLRPSLEGDRDQVPQLERALVPLDGSAVAETALDVVLRLAGGLLRHVTLLRVVSPVEGEEGLATARQYLRGQHLKLAECLVGRSCAISDLVLQGDPAERIIQSVRKEYDLIVMATHGETGIRRWAVGSVADRVLHDADVPLLVVHP